jgi:alkaline phosphatase
VTSVPMLHATPAAFITHVNHRKDAEGLEKGLLEVLPTAVVGTCADIYYPSEETIEAMRSGSLSSMYTVFEQKQGQMADNFYDGLEALDPDKGDKIFACMGGDFARVKGTKGTDNMPYRGVDSTYSARYCSNATIIQEDVDDSGTPIPVGIDVTTSEELCDHYGPEDRAEIPKMAQNVKATLEFLAKDDDGFFMMYEQGDIDWAAHANHMDDLLGTSKFDSIAGSPPRCSLLR